MKIYIISAVASVTVVSLTGCVNITLGQNIRVNTVLKSCEEAKYDSQSELTIGFDAIESKDKLVSFNLHGIPEQQRRVFENQVTRTAQDSFLSINTYQPLQWQARKAPVFELLKGKIKYAPIGQAGGNMDNLTAKIMLGSNINPGRKLNGKIIFDVPYSETYTLIVSMGRFAGGWNLFSGNELMRCLIKR